MVGFIFTNSVKNHKMLGLIRFLMEMSEWANFVCNAALSQTEVGHRYR